jgi:predicted transcriptional regulator
MKVTTVRLEDQQGRRLGVIAPVEGVTVSDLIRTAVDDCISRRCSDESFKTRLEKALESERKMADSLFPEQALMAWREGEPIGR